MCAANDCHTATCKNYPEAICVMSFCGTKACQAVFYDEDQNELDCNGGNGIKGRPINAIRIHASPEDILYVFHRGWGMWFLKGLAF